jgi:hypothetical protein
MPIYIDVHRDLNGLDSEALGSIHRRDRHVQDKYGVRYLKNWYSPDASSMFCLIDAPSKEVAEAVHRESHGLIADEIIEVVESV